MNLSEMESKVREATNNEPWGAPTTLMSQIAAGTYNFREREEILSFIFRRFTEKAANEWRQIYKALQLLDYLIKNGSERLIDDVRSNKSLIDSLKWFNYYDSKNQDKGVNVRNKAKKLLELLKDDELIRLERKKAKANSNKFGGVSSAAFGGASSITTNGGFGGDDEFTNRVYGDGGVFGARYDDPASAYQNGATGTDNNFEEYDVEGTSSKATKASKPTTGSLKVHATSSKNKAQPEAPQQDLLGDLVDFGSSSAAAATQATSTSNAAADDDDDDFDDFQTAPTLSANTGNLSSNLANLYVSLPRQPQTTQFNAGSLFPQAQQQTYAPSAVNSFGPTSSTSGPAKPSNDAFSSLFSSAKTKTTSQPKAAPAQTATPATKTTTDEDLFGGFSSNSNAQPTQTNSNSGEIDLLSF